MKIIVGSGKRYYGEEYLHIDGDTSFDHVKHYDIINLPAEDNSVDLIYACHVFEYFDRDQGAYVLKRWFDKLKPGGILRLAVPDFQMMASLYVVGGCKIEDILGPIYGRWKMGEKEIWHKTAYDSKSLGVMLHKTGFKESRAYDWRTTEHAHIDDHSQAYLPKLDKEYGTLISLNIEAIK